MKLLAWFCDLDALAAEPDLLSRLQGEIGLQVVIPESHLYHTSGFRISEKVAHASPLADWRSSPHLSRHQETHGLSEPAYPVVPGILGGVDDSALRAVLRHGEAAGVDVWGHFGLWSYGGEIFPEYMMQCAWGEALDPQYRRWGVAFCPNVTEINDWVAECLREILAEYPIRGMFLDHARFAAPAHLPGLSACACDRCRQLADDWGYSSNAMLRAAATWWLLLPHTTSNDGWRRLAEAEIGGWEFLEFVTADTSLAEWFDFRSRVIAQGTGELLDIAKEVRGPDFPFGADSYPPSVSFIGGHRLGRWSPVATDYLTGGHGRIVSWQYAGPDWTRSMAVWLHEQNPDLDPFVVQNGLARLAGLNLDAPIPNEWRRLAALRDENVPAYPALNCNLEAETLRRDCTLLTDLGFEGAIVSGLPVDDPERLAILREFVES